MRISFLVAAQMCLYCQVAGRKEAGRNPNRADALSLYIRVNTGNTLSRLWSALKNIEKMPSVIETDFQSQF